MTRPRAPTAANFVPSCQTVSGLPGNAVFAKLHLSISSAMFKNYTGWVCILWAMAFSSDAIAQAGADTLIRNHWELGVDVLSLFDKNNVPAATIFARYNYRQRLAKGRAWRFRVGVDTERREFDAIGKIYKDTWRGYNLYLSIGHEWQFRSERSSWFVGGDVVGQYYHLKARYLVFPSPDTYEDVRVSEMTTSILVITGWQYAITRQIAVSLESALSASYYYRRYNGEAVLPHGGVSWENDKIIKTNIRPFWVILLTYKFNTSHAKIKK